MRTFRVCVAAAALVLSGCGAPKLPSPPPPPAPGQPGVTVPWAWGKGPSGMIEFGFWEETGPYSQVWRDGPIEKAPPLPTEYSPADVPASLRDQIPAGASEPAKRSSRDEARESVASFAGVLGWMARFAAIAAALSLVARFIPVIGKYIPGESAVWCAVFAVGSAMLQYITTVYLAPAAEVVFWVSAVCAIGACAAFVIPAILAIYRRRWFKTADQLIEKGHVREGVAILSDLENKSRQERKELVNRLEDGVEVG